MADYVEISILEAAARCGIKFEDCCKAEVTVNCPFCDDKKRHMRLNTVKNLFYCPRCGKGGNSLTLFAKLTNTDNKTAYRELTAGNIFRPTVIYKRVSDSVGRVPLSITERNAVYTELLQNLDLSAKHKNNLLNRGLDIITIERNLYRTVPDSTTANRIARELAEQFQLAGVPGFYTKDKAWRMFLHKGFFIPIRSADGLIKGLQVRLDDMKNRKYRWFSSNHKENGIPAHSWIHVANIGCGDVFVTEGALKADVSAHLSGYCFIGLSGANCINGLIPILNIIAIG